MQLSRSNEAGVEDNSAAHRVGGTSTGTSSNLENSGQMGARDESKIKINLPKRRPTIKVGRNEPCACGSGKKFKSCCGREA